jgi:AcrR family transcriptional regulator
VANAPRTRLEPEARRAQLVDVGLQMLGTRPLEQVAIDDVAAAAGISRGLLFHYFPTKRDFHVAVAEAAAAELLARTDPDPGLAPLARLQAAVAAYVDYVADKRDAYVAFVRGSSGGDPQILAVHDRTRTAFTLRVLDGLGLPSPPPRVRVAVRGWVAFTEEVTVDWLAQGDLTRAEVLDLLDEALVALVTMSQGDWPPD